MSVPSHDELGDVPGSDAQIDPAEQIARLEMEVASLRTQLDAAWVQLQSMRASMSWRFTYPLRAVRRRWPQ